MSKVLITGGAGFIGSSIVNRLYLEGKYEVVVLDNFSQQIHGDDYEKSFLYNLIKDKCIIIKGDIRNKSDLEQALQGVDVVIHLAAETGTGQSMYEISRYTDVNIVGTSNLLDVILNKKLSVQKIILSSSRSVYGEGMYSCSSDGVVFPNSRDVDEMMKGDFSNKCPICGENVKLINTTEECRMAPISYYAFTKLSQEKMLQTMCPIIGMTYTIFRYQNVYGIGQSLENPYTGILSIFSKLLLQNKPVNIFEDGKESRDFVNIKDVARITCNAIDNRLMDNEYINVGSGFSISVLKVVETLKTLYNSSSSINVTGNFRKGDIRHNIADITKARNLCSFTPEYTFENGMKNFTSWVKSQNEDGSLLIVDNKYEKSLEEMKKTNMFIE